MKFDRLLFWLGILEQGRVKFDSWVFPYTQPEHPRVKILFACLEKRQTSYSNLYSISQHIRINLIPILLLSTTN